MLQRIYIPLGTRLETTFTISQFLRNYFPPALPAPALRGDPGGSGQRGSCLPHLGFVLGAADSPIPSPAALGVPRRSGWCLPSWLCFPRGSEAVGCGGWKLEGLQQCSERWSLVVARQLLHLHLGWVRLPSDCQDTGLGSRAVVRDEGYSGDSLGQRVHVCSGHFCLHTAAGNRRSPS